MSDSLYRQKFDEIRAKTPGSRPYLTGEKTMSYAQLFERVDKVAGLLAENGIGAGDRAVIVSRNDLEVITLFLGLLRCGVAAVPSDPEATPAMVWNVIRASKCKAIFVDANLVADLGKDELSKTARVFEIEAGTEKKLFTKLLGRSKTSKESEARFPALWSSLKPAALPATLDPDVTGLILFTSGTTSKPKGVELTHKNLMSHMATLVRHYGFSAETRLLDPVPLHHTDGIAHGALLAFSCGGALIRDGRFQIQRVAEFLESIYLRKATHLYAVPAMLSLMLRLGKDRADSFVTDDFKFVVSGGGHLDENLWKDFEANFKIRVVNAYGLTESVSQSLYSGPDDGTRRVGTLGKPVDTRTRVIDDKGNDVPPGTMGELLLGGDHIMKGYLDDPEATNAVLKSGWLHTGDLVQIDPDGFYKFMGRKKNIIVRGGANIYPEDISFVLRTVPGVADAVVMGWEDPVWEQRVVVAVEGVPGHDLTPDSIRLELGKKLSREQLPDEVHMIERLPRGPAGKIIQPQVREMILALKGHAVGGEGDVRTRIYKAAAGCFRIPVSQVKADLSPDNTTGWDSLAHMEFVTKLEQAFDVTLEPRDIMKLNTVGDAETIVQQKLAAKA
jgi:long-chain acyl-CoA synthetase